MNYQIKKLIINQNIEGMSYWLKDDEQNKIEQIVENNLKQFEILNK